MDFALILLIALIIFGTIWLIDKLFFRARRDKVLQDAIEAETLNARGVQTRAVEVPREPVLVEYARALFPVIFLVLVLRSFIVEPFRIPSGSMLPTLEVGDFILVNKFVYGIRLPVINKKVIPLGSPDRGDVMVFRFPMDQRTNFIKRVVGLPGDKIVYDQKRLFINGQPVAYEDGQEWVYTDSGSRVIRGNEYTEMLGDNPHQMVIDQNRGTTRSEHTVPEGQFFVLGDNRDHSNDSRVWGFVPEDHIVGKAFFIWFNWNRQNDGIVSWSRIGDTID